MLGSWPIDQATYATEVQIDFSDRGGWVMMSRRPVPCGSASVIGECIDVPVGR